MKKTISFILGSLLAASLIACAGSSKSDSTMPKPSADSTAAPAPSGDQTTPPPAAGNPCNPPPAQPPK
jgi:hypothetical protein